LANMASAHHSCPPTDLASYFTWLTCYALLKMPVLRAGPTGLPSPAAGKADNPAGGGVVGGGWAGASPRSGALPLGWSSLPPVQVS